MPTPTAIVQAIADIFTGCYIKISPSGTGLSVIFKAIGFKYDSAKYYINNSKLGVEVYVYGATNKFVTVIGNVHQHGDVIEAEAQDIALWTVAAVTPITPVSQLPQFPIPC